MKTFLLVASCLISVNGFSYQAKPYDFPKPVNTTSKSIFKQDRKQFSFKNGVYFDNTFKSANIGKLEETDSSYIIYLVPENEPINYSPWYAFKVWAKKDTVINVVMDYGHYKYGQRYWPKLSTDGEKWNALSEASFLKLDSTKVRFRLAITDEPLLVSAQEIQDSEMVIDWSRELKRGVYKVAGKSKLGRDIPMVEISTKKSNPVVVIFSRQHPPEVTGYLAMQSFMKRILEADELSNQFLKKYTVLMFPLLNPDGVDLGHWRHNAGGVDLNRDWAYYNQPETRQVADYIVNFVSENDSKVVLGLDFHSTFKDIYYTNIDSLVSTLPGFSKEWISQIKNRIEDDEARVSPSGLGKPVSKSWFFTQFGAEGITYEIGDNTDRKIIEVKGAVSAEEMMKLLIKETN